MDLIIGPMIVTSMSVIITIAIIVLMHSMEENKKAKAQIIKIVQQAGGKNIKIRQYAQVGTKGMVYFDVSYIDINGEHQTRQASKKYGTWSLVGDFYWDRPVQMPEPSVEGSHLASKEQIINDMDVEIRRLQEELARAKKESE